MLFNTVKSWRNQLFHKMNDPGRNNTCEATYVIYTQYNNCYNCICQVFFLVKLTTYMV